MESDYPIQVNLIFELQARVPPDVPLDPLNRGRQAKFQWVMA